MADSVTFELRNAGKLSHFLTSLFCRVHSCSVAFRVALLACVRIVLGPLFLNGLVVFRDVESVSSIGVPVT
mgnify:CR=1 FL=1